MIVEKDEKTCAPMNRSKQVDVYERKLTGLTGISSTFSLPYHTLYFAFLSDMRCVAVVRGSVR